MIKYKVTCSNCNPMSINGLAMHETGSCHGTLVFNYRKRDHYRVKVFSLDVFGNSKDGFEVNDRSHSCDMMIPVDCTHKELIRLLKRKNLLNKHSHFNSYIVDWFNDYIDVLISDGYQHRPSDAGLPLYTLEIT